MNLKDNGVRAVLRTIARLSVLGFLIVFGPLDGRAETVGLDRIPHIHGIGIDPSAPGRVMLATHTGIFVGSADGQATRRSEMNVDFMSFAAHPTDPTLLYASGHPQAGGNLGLMHSRDGGKKWEQLSEGLGGPVDFHALTVSPADPKTLYGTYKEMQVSRDGGETWNKVGQAPSSMFDLAASAHDVDRLYAATRDGLLFSTDGGRAWQQAFMTKRPATMVHAAPDGRLFAFIYGMGLFATQEPTLDWKKIATGFQDRAIMDLAVDPENPDRLYALADTMAVMTSGDGGKTWTAFEGSNRAEPDRVAAGKTLFEETCQACHGVGGTGEPKENLPDAKTIPAPALDDSMHGWHHSDENLIRTILEGSPREGSRMMAWKDSLSREDAENLVAYIKSLWSFRSLACQGGRHMRCMQH